MTIANNDWPDGDRNLSKLATVAPKRSATATQMMLASDCTTLRLLFARCRRYFPVVGLTDIAVFTLRSS
jgi:hypothetical protein